MSNKTTDQLIKEREDLRALWLKASLSDRKIIEQRGKLLTWAIEERMKLKLNGKPEEWKTTKAFEEVFGI